MVDGHLKKIKKVIKCVTSFFCGGIVYYRKVTVDDRELSFIAF